MPVHDPRGSGSGYRFTNHDLFLCLFQLTKQSNSRQAQNDASSILQRLFTSVMFTGGKTDCFCHVITFPECPSGNSVTEMEYRNVVKYLVSIPPYVHSARRHHRRLFVSQEYSLAQIPLVASRHDTTRTTRPACPTYHYAICIYC